MKKFLVVLFAFLSLSGSDALAAIQNCPECMIMQPQPMPRQQLKQENKPTWLNEVLGLQQKTPKAEPLQIASGGMATPGAQSLEVNWAPGQALPGAFDPSQYDPSFRIPGPQFQINQPYVMAPQVPYMNPTVPYFMPRMMMM